MKINYPIYESINIREFLLNLHLSKSKIYTLFKDLRITKNDEILKENYQLKPNDIITIDYDEIIDYAKEDKPINILYEDEYLLIINKPANIIIHDDDKSKLNTLSNRVANYYYKNNINLNVRFAHRLDIDTTGIILYAKDMLTNAYLNHIISTHELIRNYYALVEGKLNIKKSTLTFNIAEDRHIRNKKRVSSNGLFAKTDYEVIKEYNNYSLVKLRLHTGRTHQIRVHMAHIKHPLLNDVLYGKKSNLINRVALHSCYVEFYHPFKNRIIKINCDLPLDMRCLCEK